MPDFPLIKTNFEQGFEQLKQDIERKRDETVDKSLQQVQEQFGATTKDVVGGLYGVKAEESADGGQQDQSAEPGTEQIGQAAAQQQAAKQAAQKAAGAKGEVTQAHDKALQGQQEVGSPEQKRQIKKQKHAARHRGEYVRPLLPWQIYQDLDAQIDFIRQQREQKEQQEAQAQEQEKQEKKQLEEQKQERKNKDILSVRRAQQKTERFVGAAG